MTMFHEPPLPEAARSPYPLQPAPIARPDSDLGPDESATARSEAVAQDAGTQAADRSWAERARDGFDRATESKAALGAAVGIGSAALLAALLYTRRGRKQRVEVSSTFR
jgi:hypothetical protein